mgnify:CR=1 FL=1
MAISDGSLYGFIKVIFSKNPLHAKTICARIGIVNVRGMCAAPPIYGGFVVYSTAADYWRLSCAVLIVRMINPGF